MKCGFYRYQRSTWKSNTDDKITFFNAVKNEEIHQVTFKKHAAKCLFVNFPWRGQGTFWGGVALYRAVARLSNVIKQKEG